MSNYTVRNPATGEVLETYPTATDAEVAEAVGAAANAYVEWGRTSTVTDRADSWRGSRSCTASEPVSSPRRFTWRWARH